MADTPRAPTLRTRLRWLTAFALGAALAFAATVAVSAAAPAAGTWPTWAAVLGFVCLVLLALLLVNRRLAAIEADVRRRAEDTRNTGVRLKEQIALRQAAEAAAREEALSPQLSPGPILHFDRTGRITRFNEAALKALGPERLDGGNVRELLPGLGEDDLDRCFRVGRLPARELPIGDHWYVVHMRGVTRPELGILYATEITDFKRAQLELAATEQRTRAILDGAADAIVIVVQGGVIQAANPSASRMLGWSYEELVGNNVQLILPELFEGKEGDRLQVLAAHARRRRTGPLEPRHFARHRDGHRVPVSLSISVYESGGVTRVSCFIRDISDRLEAEQALALQSRQLQEQNRRLEQVVAELDEFNYVASHDLQEPLRTLSACCGLLRQDLGGNLPPRAEQDLKAILDSSLRMQRLIADLLEYSRLGSRAPRADTVNLADLLDRVKTDLGAQLAATNGRIESGPLPLVRGDAMQLGRVLQNLVSNGLKFQAPGSTPLVRLEGERDGNWALITVEDNGIGIEGQYLDQVFKPFKRLHAAGAYEGSGIGLSVCRKIVERHGGTIAVASVAGQGTRFLLRLPAADAGAAQAAAPGDGA
ncbi:MAG: PAS domain S-box protein [Planctomycetes bacterium]|nr:PAS domain S-box protein [Planctomycetota bacterium]MCL4730214.1 PAS domain S-box protein [Planctomycetota bacterium]